MKSVNLNPFVFIGLIVLVLAFGWLSFTKNEYAESQRIEKEQAKKRLKIVRDSVQEVIKRKDVELLKAMRESSEADQVAEEAVKQAQKYKSKYDKIAFRTTRTDGERDSIIESILHN